MPSLLSDQVSELTRQEAFMQVDVPGDGFCGMHASITQWILMLRFAQPGSPSRNWLRDSLALGDDVLLFERCASVPIVHDQIQRFWDNPDASLSAVAEHAKTVLGRYDALLNLLAINQGFGAACCLRFDADTAGMSFDAAISAISQSLVENGRLTNSCRDTLYYQEVFRACCRIVSDTFQENEADFKQEREEHNAILGVNAIPYEVNFFHLWAYYQDKGFAVDAPHTCWLSSDDMNVIRRVMQLESSAERLGVRCYSGGTHWLVELAPSFSAGIRGLCEVDSGEYWVRERGSPRKVKHLAEPVVYVDENFAPLHSQGGEAERSSVHNPVHPQAEESVPLLDASGQDSDLRGYFNDFCQALMRSARMEVRGGCLSGYSLWQDPCRMRVMREAIARLDKEIADLQSVTSKVTDAKAQELLFWIAELSQVNRPLLDKMYTNLSDKYNKRNALIKLLQYVRDKLVSWFVDTGEKLAITNIAALVPLAPKICCR